MSCPPPKRGRLFAAFVHALQVRAADGLVLCYVCMRPNPRLSDAARASIGCVMWVGSVVRVVTPLQCLARVAVHKWGAGGARALSYAEHVRAPKSHGARVLYGHLHECTSVNAPVAAHARTHLHTCRSVAALLIADIGLHFDDAGVHEASNFAGFF